jgi:L-amino acid N-acyltransferase YncA
MRPDFALRPALAADLPQVQSIYAVEVTTGTASFELVSPDVAELGRRHARVVALGLPWLVAESADGIGGFAYATSYRERPAYRFTVEDSVYVATWARGRGLGRALLEAVITGARDAGAHQMVAVIGNSANQGSVALHKACGFADVGVLRDVGLKFDRWLDTVLMQRAL